MIDEWCPVWILALRNSADSSLSFLFCMRPLSICFRNSELEVRLDSKESSGCVPNFLRMNPENLEMSLNSHWYSLVVSFKCVKSSARECPTTTLLFKIFFNCTQISGKATYDWGNLRVGRSVLEVVRLDARDGFPIVDNLGPRFDKGVKDYIAVEVDDRDSRESVALLGQDPLTVDCQDFSLPIDMVTALMHLLATFRPLVEHLVEDDAHIRALGTNI